MLNGWALAIADVPSFAYTLQNEVSGTPWNKSTSSALFWSTTFASMLRMRNEAPASAIALCDALAAASATARMANFGTLLMGGSRVEQRFVAFLDRRWHHRKFP